MLDDWHRVSESRANPNQLLADAHYERCARIDQSLQTWSNVLFTSIRQGHPQHVFIYEIQYSLMRTITAQCRQLVVTTSLYAITAGEAKSQLCSKFTHEIAALRTVVCAFHKAFPDIAHDEPGIAFHGVMEPLFHSLGRISEPCNIVDHDKELRQLILEFE